MTTDGWRETLKEIQGREIHSNLTKVQARLWNSSPYSMFQIHDATDELISRKYIRYCDIVTHNRSKGNRKIRVCVIIKKVSDDR